MSWERCDHGKPDDVCDAIGAYVDAHLAEEYRQLEKKLVASCRAGERHLDVPGPDGTWTTRYPLPRTWLGRWWKLRKAGYSMRH